MVESLGFASGYFLPLGIISLIVVLRTVLYPDIPYILLFRHTIDLQLALSIRLATNLLSIYI